MMLSKHITEPLSLKDSSLIEVKISQIKKLSNEINELIDSLKDFEMKKDMEVFVKIEK